MSSNNRQSLERQRCDGSEGNKTMILAATSGKKRSSKKGAHVVQPLFWLSIVNCHFSIVNVFSNASWVLPVILRRSLKAN